MPYGAGTSLTLRRIHCSMDQKDAFLLILLFAAAEDEGIRHTLSSALAFFRENKDMLALLFSDSKKDGAAAPSDAQNGAEDHANCADSVSGSGENPRKSADSVSEYAEALTIDPKVLSAFFKLQQRG